MSAKPKGGEVPSVAHSSPLGMRYTLCTVFDVSVEFWPPDIAAGQGLHSDLARVPLV